MVYTGHMKRKCIFAELLHVDFEMAVQWNSSELQSKNLMSIFELLIACMGYKIRLRAYFEYRIYADCAIYK